MAETFEYPPSLANYSPLQYQYSEAFPITLKLRHHFFITRAKIVLSAIMNIGHTVRVDRHLQEEIFNVLISQGWCAALGVPVPTPLFLQEYLLSSNDDPERTWRHKPSLVRLFMRLEVSALDRRFHDDIMGADGKWWLSDHAKPFSFSTLWQLLEDRTAQLTEIGLLPSKPWQTLRAEELEYILDPAACSKPVKPPGKVGNSGLRRKPTRCTTSAEMLAKQIGLPDSIELSAVDIQDLEHIDHITQLESQIMRMGGNEADVVETEKWNVDVVQQLLSLSLTEKRIPFGKRDELFDLRPTFDDPPSRKVQDKSDGIHSARKGKGQATDDKRVKRSIYQMLPADAKESWLGEPADPLPAMPMGEGATTFDVLLEDTLPDLFGPDANHKCVYRDIAMRYVQEDLQRRSTQQVAEVISTYARTGTRAQWRQWPKVPPMARNPVAASNLADREVDPIPGIFQQIAAIARDTSSPPSKASPPSVPHSSDLDESDTSGSCWGSEDSEMVEMEGNLELELDTGDATFATS